MTPIPQTIKLPCGLRNNENEWVEGDLLHGVGEHEGKMFILPIQRMLPTDCHGKVWIEKMEELNKIT